MRNNISLFLSCTENMSAVYDEREKLAKYFLDENDLWLADHFFQSCLDTAKKIYDGGDRKEAEAHCHIGLGFERRSEFYKLNVFLCLQFKKNKEANM